MYCDGPCDWWEPAALAYYGVLSLMVIVALLVIYGLYRLVRRLLRDHQDSA